ncbi:MAG: hypothetical protein DHS20C12_19390 [Pseudohongiella sp.]|nr:MAG: hypothetical protein DHS20C12_19390 [Pseudohongiella sp.]
MNSIAPRRQAAEREINSIYVPIDSARIEASNDRLNDGSSISAQSEPKGIKETLSTSNEPSSTDATDDELMQAVCRGDKVAYQKLVKAHLKSISHYAYRLLGNQKDTEDITQEVFLRLWTNAKKFRSEKSKLTTWLHRITHNLCIDYLRKHGRMQTQDAFDDEADDTDSVHSGSVEQKDKHMQLMREAMNRLPENQRSALSLCHYQGFSNKEAAAIMNISVKALESAIARAKRSLRETLSNDND